MAVGIIFVYLTPGYAPNLMSFLFGNILSVTSSDLIWMGIVDLAIVIVFAVWYRPILYVAFDREYARSQKHADAVDRLPDVGADRRDDRHFDPRGGDRSADLAADHARGDRQPADPLVRTDHGGASAIGVLGSFAGLYVSYKGDIPSGASTIFILTLTLIIVKLLPLRDFMRKRDENGT